MEEKDPVLITLFTIANGQAVDVFQREFDKVLANIEDESTEATASREIVMKFKVKPSKMRDEGSITVTAVSKLAAVAPITKQVLIGRHRGKLAAAQVLEQSDMFDNRPATLVAAHKQESA